jgi:hypothetical protein
MNCVDFIFYFIIFSLITSNFEITPIKLKKCNFKILNKELISLEENIINNIIKINLKNLNDFYLTRTYKITLNENNTHIVAYVCEDIEEYHNYKVNNTQYDTQYNYSYNNYDKIS